MCYEKRPKYLGAFTPAYKTYIMYFIKLLKLLLLSSPCHRESSTEGKVSEKRNLSRATDATRSKGDPARTKSDISRVLPPFPPSSSARGCQTGLLQLPPPQWHTSGLAHLEEPPPGSTDKPLRLLLPGYPKNHHRANPAFLVTRRPRGGLREERGTVTREGPHKSVWEGQGHSRSLTRRLLGVQRRWQLHQAFSTTPLFWFVPFLTQFILQAWLSPI